jgi:hypothetical protein
MKGYGGKPSLLEGITRHFPGVTKDNHDKLFLIAVYLPEI